MPLSDIACRTSKPREKPYKLSDGGGLYLLVEKNGSKLWRHAFRFDAKQKLVALGAYPAVSLAEARTARDANKALLAKGLGPSAHRSSESLIEVPRALPVPTRSGLSRKSSWRSSKPKAMIRKPSKRRNGCSASSMPTWVIARSRISRRRSCSRYCARSNVAVGTIQRAEREASAVACFDTPSRPIEPIAILRRISPAL
jgi:hypothetical protein